jgi:endo-1,4-beta-xylanase
MLDKKRITVILVLVVFFGGSLFIPAQTPPSKVPMLARSTMFAQFTQAGIQVDGAVEPAWNQAKRVRIEKSMVKDLSAPAAECKTYGEALALWDGAQLYILIQVTDADVTTASKNPTNKDGVEIYLDYWNDKYSKNEEDDVMIRISSAGELSGSGFYVDRLKTYAAAPRYNSGKTQIGYNIELSLSIGGRSMLNGTTFGVDFGINDASSSDNACKYRIYWNDGNNKGLDDNTRWGDLRLSGYDGKSSLVMDSYMLEANINKAEALPRGIWVNEMELDKALALAKQKLKATSQTEIDASAAMLDRAIKALRRKGKYPDPYDLTSIAFLPDPFAFVNGNKVRSMDEWISRKKEIRDLAQYYEYGYMPEAPEAVEASVNDTSVTISVKDKGKSASFNAQLSVPTVEQCGKLGPYPIIVSIDFWASQGNAIFLKAGYAVLSIAYSSVASDDDKHTGAFFALYPYDVVKGKDVGVLLAWAWGASRAIDALQYMAKNDAAFANAFDLSKLVVTGFSRCGKAALVAGFLDERFGVVNPGASGSGGAAPYRYVSFNNRPYRKPPYGNQYEWGISPGCEVLGDHVRYQGHNSNEMLARFLNQDRIYKTNMHGYGERLPFDHHEIIAAIAPRAVIITAAVEDYANNAEGDSIGLEGARPVYRFFGAEQNLALNLRMKSEGNARMNAHSVDNTQLQNLVAFANMVFYGISLSEEVKAALYANPYLKTYDTYYSGLNAMMPWAKSAPIFQ